VCAVGTSDVTHPAGPTLFRTYYVAKTKEQNCSIWEAARATSATPNLFKRIKIGLPGSAVDYVDARLGCNNPIKQVVAEASRVFGDDAHFACVLNIGTGQVGSVKYHEPDVFQRWLPVAIVKILEKIITDSERTAEEMSQMATNSSGLYHRLDVGRGSSSVSLDEWNGLGDVRLHTKN
jgi:patatin-like phospholipase/acyl hydrolase